MSRWSSIKDKLDHPISLAEAALSEASDAIGAIHDAPRNLGSRAIDRTAAGTGTLVHKVLAPALNEVLDSTHPKEWYGDAQYASSKYATVNVPGLGEINPLSLIDTVSGGKLKRDEVIAAHDKGGGRGVWEAAQGHRGRLERGAWDVAIDPTTYLTAGGTSVGDKLVAKGVALGADASKVKQVAGVGVKGLGYTSKVLELPDKATDKILAPALGAVAKTRVGQFIAGDSDRSAIRRSFDFGQTAWADARRQWKGLIGEGYSEGTKLGADLGYNPGIKPVAETADEILNVINNPIEVPAEPVKKKRGRPKKEAPTAPVAEEKWQSKIFSNDPVVNDGKYEAITTVGGKHVVRESSTRKIVQEFPSLAKARAEAKRLTEEAAKTAPTPVPSAAVVATPVNTTASKTSTAIAPNPTGELAPAPTYKVDYSKITDRVLERGPYAGQSIRDVIPDAVAEADDEIDFIRNVNIVVNGKITDKVHPRDKKRLAELTKKYGKDPRIMTDDQIRQHAINAVLESDPTIPTLSPEANAWLWDNNFKAGDYKGQSYGEALKNMASEYRASQVAIINDIGGPDAAWASGQKYISDFEHRITDKKVLKQFQDWASINIDPIHYAPEDAAFVKLEREAYRDSGLETRVRIQKRNIVDKMKSIYGDGVAVWKGVALLSPRYQVSNVSSNWINVALTHGLSGLATPKAIYKQIMASFGEAGIEHQIASSEILDTLDDYGITKVDPNISSIGFSEQIGGSFDSAPKFFSEILGNKTGTFVGRKVGAVVEFNRKISIGIDVAARTSLWHTAFKAEMEQRIPNVMKVAMEQARLQGLQVPDEMSLLPYRDPAKLLGYYKAIGFEDGRARHITRVLAGEINKAKAEANKPVHKALFSYYKTPLDELVGKVLPFHYYASRATALYGEEILRSPFIALNLTRAMRELSDTDQAGLNARQKGWLAIVTGPAGFTLMANPDALLGITKATGMLAGETGSKDATDLGKVLGWMKQGGYGMFPWFDGMFNMLGAYGDTFEPDMLGIRHRAIVGAIINSIHASTGLPGHPEPFYAGANAQAREHVSTWAAAFLPGWLSQPVKAKNNRSGSLAEATMDKAIESRIISNNPGMTNQDLLDIMNDPDSDAYQQAWSEVARSGLATQLLSFTLPGLKVRDSKMDVRDAKVGLFYDRLNNGQSTTYADAEFAAEYKRLTGEEWKPGSLDKALMESDMASATPKARTFLVSQYYYHKLGSKTGREVKDIVNKIKYDGYVPKGFQVPAKGSEKELADAWVGSLSAKQQSAYGELLDLQQAFRASHPEYGDYLDWTGQISYLVALVGDSGYSAYRSKVSEGNPNAKLYFDAKIATARRLFPNDPKKAIEFLNKATTSPDAYFAVTGQAQSVRDSRPSATNTMSSTPYDPQQGMIEQATPWNDAASQSQAAPVDPWSNYLQSF